MYILDTNAIYNFVNPTEVDPEVLAEVQEKAYDGLFKVAYTPISVIELVSHIHDTPADFDQIKKGVQCILAMKAECFPDPERRMAEIVKDRRMPASVTRHWIEMMETINRATDVDSFVKGFDDYSTGTSRKVAADYMSRFRGEYEKYFIDSLIVVTKEVNPKYEVQLRRGDKTKIKKSEQEALRIFLDTTEWRDMFRDLVVYRSGAILPIDYASQNIILRKINYFKKAYEHIVTSILCKGYQPSMKKKNDFNDIHLFLYLDEFSSNVLVSSEKKFKHMIGNNEKVISLDEFIDTVVKL